MIKVENLTKKYAGVTAIDNLSFEVEKGEVVGFLGPNGAGKSTTMRILTGYLPATSGRASIAGFDVFEHSLEARQHIGYLPENTPLYHDMRVSEYLRYRAALKGVPRGKMKERVGDVLELCESARRRAQAHRHALQRLPAARRPRRCARPRSRSAHPRRADHRPRSEPNPPGARADQEPRAPSAPCSFPPTSCPRWRSCAPA